MPKLEPKTNNTSNHTHKQQSSGTTAKDDLSTTHPLDTSSCTLDTSDPNRKTVATDMLINFTIWNQPIVRTILNAKPTRGLYSSSIQIETQYHSKVCFDWSE